MVVKCAVLGRVHMRQQVFDDSLRAQKTIEEQLFDQGYAILTLDVERLLDQLRQFMQQRDQFAWHVADHSQEFLTQCCLAILVELPCVFLVALEAKAGDCRVERYQEGPKEENKLVADESEKGMLALLKQVVFVLETLDVVTMQVVQHVSTSIYSALELLSLPLFLLCEVDTDEGQMQLVRALCQQSADFIELIRENELIYLLEVDCWLILHWVHSQSPSQLQEVIPRALLTTQHIVHSLQEVFSIAMIALPIGGSISDEFDASVEWLRVGKLFYEGNSASWMFVRCAGVTDID